MPESTTQIEIQLDPQGRIVIPAYLRRTLGFEAGDRLIARKEDGRLVLEKPEVIKQRLKKRFAHIPSTISLAQQLIDERKKEADEERQTNDSYS